MRPKGQSAAVIEKYEGILSGLEIKGRQDRDEREAWRSEGMKLPFEMNEGKKKKKKIWMLSVEWDSLLFYV